MKKILFLDANETVVEAIKYAKSRGYYTISCDNKIDNIGHLYSDKQFYISTYDVASLFKLVETEKIDGVVYFTSQHGLYGACRIIEKYSLPGFPFNVEQTISNKYNFRLFLSEHGFNVPKYVSLSSLSDLDRLEKIPYPLIVKPVDNGGNCGITKVECKSELSAALQYAFNESLSHKLIVEEYISSDFQINGDCLYVQGKLVFSFLGRYLYPNKESILPFATIFGPDIIPSSLKKKVDLEIQEIITKNHLIDGILNVELRVDNNGQIYFIEINPRHSGNRIYSLMNEILNIPMEHIAVDLSLGNTEFMNYLKINYQKYYAYCLLFSEDEGIYDKTEISDDLQKFILTKEFFKERGDLVKPFTLLKERIGLLHLCFPSIFELDWIFNDIHRFFKIKYLNENK